MRVEEALKCACSEERSRLVELAAPTGAVDWERCRGSIADAVPISTRDISSVAEAENKRVITQCAKAMTLT